MKKSLILSAAAALLLSSASCGGSSATSAKDLKTTSDSLTYYFGEMIGADFNAGIKQMNDSTFKKDSFLKGVAKGLSTDTTDASYIQGLSTGLQILSNVKGLQKEAGVKVDMALLAKIIEATTLADSTISSQEAQATFSALMQRLANEKKMNDPKVIANKKSGEARINEEMKKDPSIKKTATGLAYKVVSEGAGNKFTETDKIMVKYTGKKIDGTEFDKSGDEARQFSPNQVVPGFKEGLLMMAPGAKYILYIPGELAYGIDGQPMAGIGPNEMLIFEVETVGLAPEAPKN